MDIYAQLWKCLMRHAPMFVLSIKENKNNRDTPGTKKRSIFLRSFFSATASKYGSVDLVNTVDSVSFPQVSSSDCLRHTLPPL